MMNVSINRNRAERRAALKLAAVGSRGALRTGNWAPWEERPAPSHAGGRGFLLDDVFQVWNNNIYIVMLRAIICPPWGACTHLMIRRIDAAAVHSWSDFQRIKNELCGAERVAFEIYPRASELVDAANLYHLVCLPEGESIAFDICDPEKR